jgi:hypothetical protein
LLTMIQNEERLVPAATMKQEFLIVRMAIASP